MKDFRRGLAAVAWLAAVVLAGCMGQSIRTYPNTAPPNLQVRSQVDPGSGLKSAAVDVDIYRALPGCRREHLGRVELHDAVTKLGLPTDEPLYLEFLLMSKSFWSSSAGAMRYDTQLTARGGYAYDVELKFGERSYSVVMKETRQGSAARIIERKSINECVDNKGGKK
jgi:hypothetical protein